MLNVWSTHIGEYAWPLAEQHNARLASEILRLHAALDLGGQGRVYPRMTQAFERGGFGTLDIRPFLGVDFWKFLCASAMDYLAEVGGKRHGVVPSHITSIWPNVNASGEYHRPHRHGGNEHVVVGTYYVQAPEAHSELDGALCLSDPRGALGGTAAYRRFYGEDDVLVLPRPGVLVLFPPHLLHYVLPHRSERPRISISFNVSIAALAASGEALSQPSARASGPTS